jgi:hypothetical protein
VELSACITEPEPPADIADKYAWNPFKKEAFTGGVELSTKVVGVKDVAIILFLF